ncbi:hypothetical protein N8976_03650 [Gammaproteobacteria bacterium]|nr:hypothetical protein [Gammaproteobacteria bacterium]
MLYTLYFFSISLSLLLFSSKASALNLNTEKTAIIVIDVWNETFLDEYVKNSLNPFLIDAHKNGFLLINATSQNETNKFIKDIFDYTLYNLDPLFPILNKHNIENIVYVGYDKLLCLLDKPAGAFHLQNLGFDYNFFVLNDLSVSLTKEMDDLSKHFFSELKVKEIDSKDLVNKSYKYVNNNYRKTNLFTKRLGLGPSKPLFIIFKQNKDDFNKTINKIKELNHPVIEVINGDSPINEYDLVKYIKDNKISDLIWGGYYVDSEVIFHKLGILNLYIKNRHYNIDINIPKNYILDELFFIKNNQLDLDKTKAVLVNYYRNIGITDINTIPTRNSTSFYEFISIIKYKISNFYFGNMKAILSLILILFLSLITSMLIIKKNRP